MSQPKVFTILSAFSVEEFQRFGSFIVSPYFNTSKEVINLFNRIKKFHPGFNNKALEYKKIYKRLYPNREYKEGTLRNLLSDLGILAYKYLAFINYEETPEYRVNILKQANRKSLDKYFIKNYENYLTENEKTSESGIKSLNSFLLKREMISFRRKKAKEYQNNSESDNTIDLLVFFLKEVSGKMIELNRLRYRYNTFDKSHLPEKILDSIDFKELMEYLKKNNFKEAEDIEIDYLLRVAEKLEGDEFEQAIKEAYFVLKKYEKRFTVEELYSIYVRITSIIDNNCSATQKTLLYLLFEIRKEFVLKFMSSKRAHMISAADFKSIIDTALVLKEYEWAKNFLDTGINFLNESIKDDFYHLYMARIYHYLEDFEKSNGELAKSTSNHAMIKLDIKILRLLNLYKLSLFESAFSFTEAARQHLKINKFISEDIKIYNLNFLKIFNLLLRKKTKEMISVDEIKNQFEKVKKFTRFGPWIYKEIERL